MRLLRASTAASIMVLMVDSTDHVTGKTGLTLTITASKVGGAFASITPTVNERGSGWYEIQLSTTDTNSAGELALHITAAGADPADILSTVVQRYFTDLAYPLTTGRYLDVDVSGRVSVGAIGSAVIEDSDFNENTHSFTATLKCYNRPGTGTMFMVTWARNGRQLLSGVTNVSVSVIGQFSTLLSTTYMSEFNSTHVWTYTWATELTEDTRYVVRCGMDYGGYTYYCQWPICIAPGEQLDVIDIGARIPAALVAGRMDAYAGDIAAGSITSSEAPALANLDAAVSSRSSHSAADVRVEIDSNSTQLAGIKAKTDNLPSGVKRNTALAQFSFLMVDSADHVTPKTGLTVTAQRSLDGAAFGACANSPTELSNGIYLIDLAAGDLDGAVVTFRFTATGGDARLLTVLTEP